MLGHRNEPGTVPGLMGFPCIQLRLTALRLIHFAPENAG